VMLRQEGVGARSGRARVVPGPAGNAGMTRLDVSDEVGDVDVVSLDDSLAALGLVPTVVKVDVEGMEVDVLRGAEQTLRRHRPALYVEAAEAEALEAVRDVLGPLGYGVAARFNATPTYLFLPGVPAAQSTPRALEHVSA
jgi:protein O-GlcNAc transferase